MAELLKIEGVHTISTHTPHARRDLPMRSAEPWDAISTHTPHARRDNAKNAEDEAKRLISTHTPHARRDQLAQNAHIHHQNFNSHASCEA